MNFRLADFGRSLRLALAVGALVLNAQQGHADIFFWNPTTEGRPPLPLDSALGEADHLFTRASRKIPYCLNGRLHSMGQWQLGFMTAEGEMTLLNIGPKRTDVDIRGPESVDLLPWTRAGAAPADLAALQRRVERGIAAAAIPAVVRSSNGAVTISYRVRNIRVHRALRNGEFSEQLSDEACPDEGGLFVRVRPVEGGMPQDTFVWAASPPSQWRSSGDGVYWDAFRTSAYLSKEKRYAAVEWRCGSSQHFTLPTSNEFADCEVTGTVRQDRPPSPVTLATIIGDALGDDAAWKFRGVPPLSAAKALQAAAEAIRPEKKAYHCFRFFLWGDPSDGRAHGSWRLFLASSDGSQKLATVWMNGKVEVRDFQYDRYWLDDKSVLSLYDAHGVTPADAAKRLQPLFAKYGVKPVSRVSAAEAIFEYDVRKYYVYPRSDQGELARDPVEVVGPTADGFWLRVTAPRADDDDEDTVEDDDRGGDVPIDSPYWYTSSVPPELRRKGRVLIELRIGKGDKTTIPADEFAKALAGG